MSFIAATATGAEAIASLERHLAPLRDRAEVTWRVHHDHAVAWTLGHPWVSSHDDGDVLVVVDGQLHNLWAAEHSPAESMYRRYRERGTELARGLLGDFVVIVLDRTRGALVVSRDPLGVRPWYQAGDGRRGAGATDIATLDALPWVNREVNEREALAYLAGLSRSRGATLYRGITTLVPGSTWRSSGTSMKSWAHHRWDIRPEPEVTWDEAVERCRSVLDEVVRDRVRAAGAATSELSGGLDSSSVVGTAARFCPDGLLVGRLIFDQADSDERHYSEAVIRHWELRAVSVQPWIMSHEDAWAWTSALRRPIPDSNFTMFAALYRGLRQEGRTAGMTGLGGDDAFVAVSRTSRVLSALGHGRYGVVAALARQDLRRPGSAWRSTWRGVVGRYLPHRRRAFVPPHVSLSAAERLGLVDLLREPRARLTGDSGVDERAGGLTSGLVASILEESAMVEDWTGWRSSHPMLDPRFITASYGLDPGFAVKDGHDRAVQRDAFRDRLPEQVRGRRSKAEFSGVVWAGRAADTSGMDRLRLGPLVARGWTDPAAMSELLTRARQRKPGTAHYFERAASLDRWLRESGG